jgi:hypothetical protein
MHQTKETKIHMTPEQKATAMLRAASPEGWFYQRIETNTGRGVPDLFLRTDKASLWIEMKASGLILRPEQWAWQRKLRMLGGLVFTICYRKDIWGIGRVDTEMGWQGGSGGLLLPLHTSRNVHEIIDFISRCR